MSLTPNTTPFDYRPKTRIVFGPGKLELLGELAQELSGKRVLLVSDPGITRAGYPERAASILRRAGLQVSTFDQVDENPTTITVDRGLAVARQHEPDLIIGLGGGSSMDCAKGINFLYTNGGRMQDYWGRNKAKEAMLPMIAVPTTAGTGSETQSFALISDGESHVKMACGDEKAACRVALLDPELTLTQPERITALTGIDAIAHAVESFVTRARNGISLAFSSEAWTLLATHFPEVLEAPSNLAARGGMQLGACFAGLAIENSMLGAAHALANPLTAHYGIAHGEAIALMLPHVIRYNGAVCEHWYAELAGMLPDVFPNQEGGHGSAAIAALIDRMAERAGLPRRLAERRIPRESLGQMGHEALEQWTAGYNPRGLNEAELCGLYEAAF